jgi:glycosyltransferase involved in cell wall biosynthesis
VDLVQTWLYHADLIGGIAARLAGLPVVWGVHHASVDAQMKTTTRLVVRSCAALSNWLPERIVCCAEATKAGHVRLGYAAAKSVVIPNGFDASQFKPDAGARLSVRQERGIQEGTILIGYFARFHPDKDHAVFVEAAGTLHRDFPDVHFVLCGQEITPDNPTLLAWVEAAGVRDRVHLLGLRQDIPRLMASLDVFSLSSRNEAAPLVIGEAMACGVPCAVTDVGDSAEMVGNTGEVVPPRDPQALALAWRRLLEAGEQRRRELGKAARLRIEENFDLAGVVRRYEALYRTVAKR